mgnify:CR=1 FL=1
MKAIVLLPLLAILIFPTQSLQTPPPDGSQIAVLSFKWSKSRQTINVSSGEDPLPASAMTPNDKAYARSAH